MDGSGQGELPVGRNLAAVILQQPGDVGVGDAVVVAAEADVVLFQLDGPKRSVELAVLILSIHVHPAYETHEQNHHD